MILAETSDQLPVTLPNLADIRGRLELRLQTYDKLYDRPIVSGLLASLDGAHELPGQNVVLDGVRENIGCAAQTTALSVYTQIVAETVSQFSSLAESENLPTPKQFLTKGFRPNGAQRNRLKVAYDRAIAESSNLLQSSLLAADPTSIIDVPIEDDEIVIAMEQAYTELARDIEETTAYIEKVLQLNRYGVLAHKVLSFFHGSLDPHTILSRPFRGSEQANLHRQMRHLADLLANLQPGSEHIINTVTRASLAGVPAEIKRQLRTFCQEMAAEYIWQVFVPRLEAAYHDEASHIQSASPHDSHMRPSAPQQALRVSALHSRLGRHTVSVPEAEPAETEEETAGFTERHVGTIPSPFTWNAGQPLEVTLIENNTGTVMFTEALTAGHQDISERLRKSPNHKRSFDLMREKLKSFAVANNITGHSHIKAEPTLRKTFMDQSVFAYRAQSSIAPRIYFARTKAGQYEELAALAASQDLGPDTEIVVIVAETDKDRQNDTFKFFGIKPRLSIRS